MKTHTIQTYSIHELKDQFPNGYKRAVRNWQDNAHEIPWVYETCESLKQCVKMAGLKLRDWNLGPYNRNNFIRIEWNDDVANMDGARAFAWLENNLFAQFRIPWKGQGRDSVRKYGKDYRPGLVKPCPLTGYCADEDYLTELRDAVKHGSSLESAFEGLADICQKLLEEELDAYMSEEYFAEHADCNELQFTEDGDIWNG